jgi:hypothetical protein
LKDTSDAAPVAAETDDAFLKRCFTEALAPKLKLFLSADIVGSTQFKQPLKARSNAGKDWSRAIKQFYDQIDNGLIGNWKSALEHLESYTDENPDQLKAIFAGDRPCRWKTVGDEILFWKILSHENQIWLTLDAWLKTIRDTRKWFKDAGTGLDIKCTAWVAGFPVRNRAIVGKENREIIENIGREGSRMNDDDFIRARTLWKSPDYPFLRNTAIIEKFYREDDWDASVDFIGPGIDRGFRIQGFSSTARMPISLDLAYLMALSVLPERNPSTRSFKLMVDGLGHPNVVSSKKLQEFVGKRFENGDTVAIGSPFSQPLLLGETAKAPALTNGLGVYYAGEALLKGVIGGVPYPNFWIDTHAPGTLDRKKSELAGGDGDPICWQLLLEFCDSFFDDRSDFLFAPFIDQPGNMKGAMKSKTLPPDPDLYPYASELEAYRMSLIGPA